MAKTSIYLDYNATSQIRPEVLKAMTQELGKPLNPSSIHSDGRYARSLVEEARKSILKSVNGSNLIFCGSGTEANNMILGQFPNSIISSTEHDSVFKSTNNPILIRVDSNGVVDLNHLEELLQKNVSRETILSIIYANNETGVIQPIAEIAALARQYRVLFHTDAIQAYGKIPIDFAELKVDVMTISGHKSGGPVGVSAIITRPGIELIPLLKGGGQEKNKRPGTENVPAIIGFGELAKIIESESGDEPALSRVPSEGQETRRGTSNISRETIHIENLRNHMESEIKSHCPDVEIHGAGANRLPNTSYLSMPSMESATQLIAFDVEGISVSSGPACSSGKVEKSRVLDAMGAKLPKNALRVSLGWATTKEEVETFIQVWKSVYNKANSQKGAA